MVTLHSVRVERGTSWEDAKRIYSLGSSDGSAGFFIAMQVSSTEARADFLWIRLNLPCVASVMMERTISLAL